MDGLPQRSQEGTVGEKMEYVGYASGSAATLMGIACPSISADGSLSLLLSTSRSSVVTAELAGDLAEGQGEPLAPPPAPPAAADRCRRGAAASGACAPAAP